MATTKSIDQGIYHKNDQALHVQALEDAPFGFAAHEIIINDDGTPVDYSFLAVNKLFEQLTGLCRKQILGKRITTVLPGIKEDPFNWIDFYGKLAQKGGSEDFEQYSTPLNRWYRVQAYSVGNGIFYTCFTDTSKEKDKIDKLESAQLTLIKSDEFLHLITQQISDVIFLADMNLKTTYITKSIEYLTGDTPDEFLARPLQQIHPPETIALLQQVLAEELARDGQPDVDPNRSRIIECEQFDKYGNRIHIAEHLRFLRDNSGAPIGFIGTTRNIHAQKSATEALKASQNYLQSLLASIPDILIIINKNGLIIEFKPGVESTIAEPDNSYIGQNIRHVFGAEAGQRISRSMQKLFTGETATTIEFTVEKANKQHFYEARAVPFLEDQVMLLIRNQDKIREAEIGGKISRTLLEAAMKQAAIGMIWVEANPMRVSMINEAAMKMIGKKPDQLTAKDYDTHVANWNLKNTNHRLVQSHEYPSFRAIHSGEVITDELFLLTDTEGKVHRILSSATPVRNAEHHIMGAMVVFHDITELWETQQNLFHANEKFKRLVENAPFITYVYSTQSNQSYHSPATELITGFPPETFDLHPEFWTSRIHPDDVIKVNESVKAARSQKIPIILEYRFLSATDEWVWLEDKSSVIHTQGNEVVVEGIIRDITQGKQDQIHIRKLLSAVEQSPVSIVITNLDAAIEYVNPHFTYISGYRPGEVLGKNPRVLQSRKSAHVNDYRGLWKTIKEGKIWKGEFVNQKKNGEEYWEQATIAPLVNEEGKTTHYIAVKEDITDRKKAELNLQSFAERLEQITKQSRTIALDLDLHGKFLYISDAIELILGYTKADLEGKALKDIIPVQWQQEAKAEWHRRITARQEFKDLRRPLLTKKGEVRWFSISGIPLVDDSGALTGMRNSMTDITEQYKAQNALKESEARFKSIFADNASPMYLIDPDNGSIVDVNTAAEKFYGWPRDIFLLKNIRQINYSLIDTVQKFTILQENKHQRFEFKHWLANGQTCDVEVFSSLLEIGGRVLIHEIIHDITALNQYLSTIDQQNKILRDITWTQSHLVRAPLARMEGLLDLLRNEAKLEPDNNSPIQTVEDVYAALHQSLSELDEMVHSVTVKAQLVQSMDHQIQHPIAPILSKRIPNQPSGKSFELLLVDDDHIIQVLQKHLMMESGVHAQPKSCMNGLEAIKQIESNQHDPDYTCLVLLDINMPVMDGWQFLDHLHQLNLEERVFVVVMTSSIANEDRQRALRYPMVVDYMQKPMQREAAQQILQLPRLAHLWA